MIPDDTTLPLDPWAASSLLHKAIRRGEADYAQIAAKAFFRYRGQAIWRRLTVIAFEDVGIGDVDLVAHVVRLGSDRAARNAAGEDIAVAVSIARALADARKDRSTDCLPYIALEHPDWARDREDIGGLQVSDRLPIALDPDEPLVRRAIATLFLTGRDARGSLILDSGYHVRLLRCFENVGMPPFLVENIEIAAQRTREPITMMLPLVWAALQHSGQIPTVMEMPLPVPTVRHGIPLYTFDLHTRIGKMAAGIFAGENRAVNEMLCRLVPEFRMRDVVAMAACYVDGVSLYRPLQWHQAAALADLDLEANMMKLGCPRGAISEIIEIVRANLDHLNSIRGRLLDQSLRHRPETMGGAQ